MAKRIQANPEINLESEDKPVTASKRIWCSPEEFFRRITEYEDPSGLMVYVYRLWPVIDRSLAGVDYKHIYATPPPFTLDDLIRQCGSGKYRLMLLDQNLPKNANKVAECKLTVNDPEYPPVVNLKELILEHEDNRSYVESLRMRGLLDKEDLPPQSPSDSAAAVAVESLSRTVADLANRMSERASAGDSDRALSLAVRIAELVRPGKDPLELATQIAALMKRDDNAVLLKALIEQQTKLTELVVQQRANPESDLEQLERLLKIAERLGKGGGSGESWGLELVRSLPATLAAAADLMRTVAAARAGQSVAASGVGAPSAPPAASPTVPAAGGWSLSMDRLVQVGQKAIVAFQRGASGDDFAHALVVSEPDGELIYDQLAALGKEGILSSLRALPVWPQLEARSADIERFVDEFLAYGQDEGE
jgi:hypothetical protein